MSPSEVCCNTLLTASQDAAEVSLIREEALRRNLKVSPVMSSGSVHTVVVLPSGAFHGTLENNAYEEEVRDLVTWIEAHRLGSKCPPDFALVEYGAAAYADELCRQRPNVTRFSGGWADVQLRELGRHWARQGAEIQKVQTSAQDEGQIDFHYGGQAYRAFIDEYGSARFGLILRADGWIEEFPLPSGLTLFAPLCTGRLS